MLNRKELRAGLNRGSVREIAQRADTRPDVVSNWFAGRFNSPKIEAVALQVLEEDVAKRQTAGQAAQTKLEAVLRGGAA